MQSSYRLMSLGLAAVVVCLACPLLVSSNSLHHLQKLEMRKMLNDKLESVDVDDEGSIYDLFEEWASAHDITFTDDNELMDALLKWKKNALKIKTHRGQYREGKHTYQIGLNQFAHMTNEEFRQKRLGLKLPSGDRAARRTKKVSKKTKRATAPLPTSINWVTNGLVTSVKDQGECGSCWTFSAAAVLEGAYAKATGVLTNFSEEQFVDCAEPYVGCDGGVPSTAVEYVAQQKGVATDLSYPYVAQNLAFNPSCQISSAVKLPMTPSYTWLNSDTEVLQALAIQPVSVCVAVGGDEFMLYESGVMNSATACDPPDMINHAVLLVGMGNDTVTHMPFWMIKNSWSTDWGENGYFRINRNVDNSCGIYTESIGVTITIP